VNGKVVLEKVPVTHLLFLEKQVMNLHTIVSKLPTLDPAEKWTFDKDLNCSVTESHDTNKTKKVMRNHVKARGHGQAPGSGRNLHRRREGRRMEHGQVFRSDAGF
jgi:hypothetical protein